MAKPSGAQSKAGKSGHGVSGSSPEWGYDAALRTYTAGPRPARLPTPRPAKKKIFFREFAGVASLRSLREGRWWCGDPGRVAGQAEDGEGADGLHATSLSSQQERGAWPWAGVFIGITSSGRRRWIEGSHERAVDWGGAFLYRTLQPQTTKPFNSRGGIVCNFA
jgi:hypothetical protein